MSITTSQELKESLGAQVFQAIPARMVSQVREESMDSRVQMEEEALLERRVHLEQQELEDSPVSRALQVHRDAKGKKAILDCEE